MDLAVSRATHAQVHKELTKNKPGDPLEYIERRAKARLGAKADGRDVELQISSKRS